MRGWHLGALSPTDATNQVFPTAKIRSGAGHNQSIWNVIEASAAAGQMVDQNSSPAYIPGTAECAAAQGVTSGAQNDLKLGQTASGLALTGLQIATSAGVIAAPFTLGISIAVSSIVGLFSTLINHHAQAVRAEQSVLCSAVPAANNYLNIISQAVASGTATPQQGIDALNSLLSDFESAVASIRQGSDPTSSGECNAACVMQSELHAIVLLMQSEFQDLINSAKAAPPQVVLPTSPNTTIPPTGAPVPASSYAPFYSPSPAAPSAPNTVAAPTTTMPSYGNPAPVVNAPSSAAPSWLPIAAMALAGIFLLREVF